MANMLVSAHGDDAEAAAGERLNTALAADDEAGEIVWRGVLTQIERIRSERAP